jgi:hypothetical protein
MAEIKCAHCGQSDVSTGIAVRSTTDGGSSKIFVRFVGSPKDWFKKEAHICSDICNNCGHVRLYVKETKKDWVSD